MTYLHLPWISRSKKFSSVVLEWRPILWARNHKVPLFMSQTDYKLDDQFVNRPPVYKLVGPLSIIQAEVVQFRNQSKRFESWLNDLQARFFSIKAEKYVKIQWSVSNDSGCFILQQLCPVSSGESVCINFCQWGTRISLHVRKWATPQSVWSQTAYSSSPPWFNYRVCI